MVVLWIALLIVITFLGYLIYLAGRHLRPYQALLADLKYVTNATAEAIAGLPVDPDSEASQREPKAREFSHWFAGKIHIIIEKLGGNHPGMHQAEQSIILDPTNTVKPKDSKRDPFLSYAQDRLLLVERMVQAHYPYPTYMEIEIKESGIPWSINLPGFAYLGLPLVIIILGGLITIGFRAELLEQVLGMTGIGMLVATGLGWFAWWRIDAVKKITGEILKEISDLARYATVPFQDRVQMDMSISLIESVSEYSGELRDVIQQHKVAVDAIPANISDQVSIQVKEGLDPIRLEIEDLRKRLSDSYENMSQSLTLTAGKFVTLINRVSDFDSYQEWANTLVETTTHLNGLAQAVTKYQAQTEGFYEDLRFLSNRLKENQEAVRESYESIARSVAARTAYEDAARGELSNLVQTHLQEIYKKEQEFSEMFRDVRGLVSESAHYTKSVNEKWPELISDLNGAIEGLRTTASAVENMPPLVKDALTRLQEQSTKMLKQSAEHYSSLLDELRKQSEKALEAFSEQIEDRLHHLDDRNEQAFSLLNEQVTRHLDTVQERNQHYLEHMRIQEEGYDSQHREYLNRINQASQSFQENMSVSMQTIKSLVDKFGTALEAYTNQVENATRTNEESQRKYSETLSAEMHSYLQEIHTYTGQIRKPEHPLHKPVLFGLLGSSVVLLFGILISLIVLISRI